MKKPSSTNLKKAPASKGQAETKPCEVSELGQQDDNSIATSSPSEPILNQPNSTELSRMAIALAQARRTPITEKNRDELLHSAYEMWEAADKLIQRRKTSAEQEAAARQTAINKAFAEVATKSLYGGGDTFKEIVEKNLLPKRVGKKGVEMGEPQFITSIEGVKKAFLKFHESGSAVFQFLLEPAAEVLKTGTMSKAMFANFLAWQKERCGLERPSPEKLLAAELIREGKGE